MGYIVPFLTISSILIDISFTNLIFIGAMFNSYNSWYLLSLPSSFTLHYSILFLILLGMIGKYIIIPYLFFILLFIIYFTLSLRTLYYSLELQ